MGFTLRVSSIFFLLFSVGIHAQTLPQRLEEFCTDCAERIKSQTGAYILEKGEEALISRAWLASNAGQTIDVQYFIWSTDNIGILASEALLTAAERGVKVRVLVDDLMVDADSQTLLILASHPNVQIKIYNPQHSVGVSFWQRTKNLLGDFQGSNQRMHDKAVIYDGLIGITGGRNMADEYFDYNHQYNFRDRDILLVGLAVREMTVNFEEFWSHPLAVDVRQILSAEISKVDDAIIGDHLKTLHAYAADETHFAPQVRALLHDLPKHFEALFNAMEWGAVRYISDVPGKNDQQKFLAGGGEATQALVEQIQQARNTLVIQSPYLVIPDHGMALLQSLIDRGVEVKISTNSLASTDNLMAFSGYVKQRKQLLKMGVQLFEFKPHPQIQEILVQRYPVLKSYNPIFAIHAKSMVIDNRTLFIGTFNLDPRSANLNTEVGVLINNSVLAEELSESIGRDMAAENSWSISLTHNPDDEVGLAKRAKLWFYKLLPLKNVL